MRKEKENYEDRREREEGSKEQCVGTGATLWTTSRRCWSSPSGVFTKTTDGGCTWSEGEEAALRVKSELLEANKNQWQT